LDYIHTPKSLAKMSGKNLVMFGKNHSGLTKEKFRQALLGENHPKALKVSVLDL
jgi:NUMOD3 motif